MRSFPRFSAASKQLEHSPDLATKDASPTIKTYLTPTENGLAMNRHGHGHAPLISVVVPVYKVERYLRQCVDSILCQTHSHLEVFLINDGSPDGSGAICDEYARRDGRVRVIHQENKGISAARNAGLDAANGEYVAFVDSDDWLEPDMLEALLDGLLKHGSDIAGIIPIPQVEDQIAVRFSSLPSDAMVLLLQGEEALQELLRDNRLRNFAWSYLYRATLFADIRFPIGRRFEDIQTTFRLFLRARRVVALPIAKYHYRIRTGSTTQALDLGAIIDRYDAFKVRHETLGYRYPKLMRDLLVQRFSPVPEAWRGAARSDSKVLARHRTALEEMARFTAANRDLIIAGNGYGMAGRMLVWLCSHPRPWAYQLMTLLLVVLTSAFYQRAASSRTGA